MLMWLHLTQEKNTPIGSSHGRLAFSGDEENPNDPFLFCPFSDTRIRLPRIHSQLDKIVLCGNPAHDPNFTALAIHGSHVAFCKPGTGRTWSRLDSDIPTAYDIICCDATKTAFILGPGPAIEAWDVGLSAPCKKSEILEDFCPEALARAGERYPSDLYTTRWYLGRAEHGSSEPGKLYIVVRYVGEFVRHDGEVVREGDTLTDDAAEPLVCPYKTVGFEVFKYSDCEGKWVVAGDLEGRAMFLGGNQTIMVEEGEKGRRGLMKDAIYFTEGEKGRRGLMKDAIYFTDDYWERLDEDYCYGGHDNGVYSMEDGSVHELVEGLEQKIVPPPCWITAPASSPSFYV
ncbi:Unknown protein [Striga hermonthica]|uniref:KIB1-4 beta-propeller domain-containing protein n=1 Tax=Striga hermonthica TaxID=68872 RepID=A0A9N7NAS2_STRHE|nr:Unknown protein [Striga hermonthica]